MVDTIPHKDRIAGLAVCKSHDTCHMHTISPGLRIGILYDIDIAVIDKILNDGRIFGRSHASYHPYSRTHRSGSYRGLLENYRRMAFNVTYYCIRHDSRHSPAIYRLGRGNGHRTSFSEHEILDYRTRADIPEEAIYIV